MWASSNAPGSIQAKEKEREKVREKKTKKHVVCYSPTDYLNTVN